jgi:FtsH Extracellular
VSSCSFSSDQTSERAPYSPFHKYLDTGQIKEVSVDPEDIEATLRNGQTIVATG